MYDLLWDFGNSGSARVSTVVKYSADAVVHNLTVARVHSYYVMAGDTAVLVHNCPGDEIAGAAEETVRMRHYTNSAGKRGITETGLIRASDQNLVFMVRAKGKPMSPRDAEATLGISKGRGRHVLDFDVPASKVTSRYNSTMGITEWVHQGDMQISKVKVIR